MSEAFGDNLDASSDRLRDKKDKTLSKEQVFAHLSRTLNAHNARIDSLSDLQGDQREKLKTDIKTFLLQSLHDTLYEKAIVNGQDTNVLGEYNALATDTNREAWLDSYEFSRYMDNLEEALRLIVELGGVEKFRKEMGVLNKGANEWATLDMDLLGDRNEKSPLTRQFTEWYGKNASNLTPEQIKDFTNSQFRWDKMKFAAGMAISLWTELWPEAVEIALNFVYDLGKAVLQLPEYLYFAFQYTRATTEVEKKEYSLKMKSRLDDNMALGLVALWYDGYVADTTSALLWANIHADTKGSRMQELIHSMGSPDTWTPAGIKEAMIWLLPVLRQAGKIGNKGSIAPLWNVEEPKRWTPPLNPNQETKWPNTETTNAPQQAQMQETLPPQQAQASQPTTLPNTPLPNASNSTENTQTFADIVPTGAVAEPSMIKRVNLGEFSQNNPNTSQFHDKVSSPENNIAKGRKWEDGEIVKYAPEQYTEAYREGIKKVGALLSGVEDHQFMSSNSMFAQFEGYKLLPDDFDIAMRDRDFSTVYKKLQDAQNKGEIRWLTVRSIDKTHKEHISDTAMQEQLLERGNLQIVFTVDTSKGIPFEAEMFPEGKWNGFTQLGHIPRTINSITLDGVEIKLASPEATADLYTLNLMGEIFNNTVEKYGEKAKDTVRTENLIRHLQGTGIKTPDDIITRMHEVEEKYRKYADGKLSTTLEGIFARSEIVERKLNTIITNYKDKQSDFDTPSKTSKLPEFQEFVETWNKKKWELHKLYLEAVNKETLTPKRIWEIENQLKIYEWEMQSIITKSLNNEDFAYFYEMNMIETEYIDTIRKLLSLQGDVNK